MLSTCKEKYALGELQLILCRIFHTGYVDIMKQPTFPYQKEKKNATENQG